MRLTVLGCQGGSTPARHLPGLLLDGTVLLEAGSVHTLRPDEPNRTGERLTVIPILVNHTVPTTGFIVHDGVSALVFSGDTGPTERLWEDGQADAGRDKGVYAEIGIAPGYTFLLESRYPLAVSIPLAVGLSLNDYYEFGTGSDDTFGYFSGGVTLSVPLAFIPPEFGKWGVKGGVTLLYLGDNLKAVNDGDELQVIGAVGLAFTY
jgi:hypothetical protein